MVQDLFPNAFWCIALLLPLVALFFRALKARSRRPRLVPPDRRARTLVTMGLAPSNTQEKMQQVRVKLEATGQEAWIWVTPSTPYGAALRQASSVLAQDLSRLEGLGGALDASKPLGPVEPGHAFTAFLKEEAKEPKAQVNDEHPAGTRVVQPIMEFGYREHFSEACAYCNRFHVIIKCPEALAEATKENVIVKFEQKEFWLTIRGQSKDFGLRRCIGRKTSLPVTFKVCPERCAVIVSPGKKVELIMKPALPSSFQPGKRVKLERLQSKDALQLNGQSGTIESYVDSEVTAVRYVVRLDDGQKLRVRPQNMRILEKQI